MHHRHIACLRLRKLGTDLFALTLAKVDSIDAAVNLAGDLSRQGVSAIELSSSFGEEGLAALRKAAGNGIDTGLFRY